MSIGIAALAATALFAVSAAGAALRAPAYLLAMPRLAPESELDSLDKQKDVEAASRQLLEKYPRDPRLRVKHAVALIRGGGKDRAAVEADLRAALESAEAAPELFRPGMAVWSRAMLAVVLFDGEKRSEARQVAAPLCIRTQPDPAEMREFLEKMRNQVCEVDPLLEIAAADLRAARTLLPGGSAEFLVPDAELESIRNGARSERDELAWRAAERFPLDPRAFFVRAAALATLEKDLPGAEKQLRDALALCVQQTDRFTPLLCSQIRAMLALVLAREGKGSADLVAPLCATRSPDQAIEEARRQLCPKR
jgi:hypothetical protein